MACKSICKMCPHLILSQSLTFNPQANVVVVGLPAGTYIAGEKYCIVIAQAIPVNVTTSATVTAVIGTATTQYPINNCDCTPLTACGLKTRTRYSTRLITTAAGASFRMLGKVCRCTQRTGAETITG